MNREMTQELRESNMSVGMAVKLAGMTRSQACEQAYRDAELQIRHADMARQRTEDVRSIRRNRNRLYMLLAGFFMALLWPAFCNAAGLPGLVQWTAAIAVTGDLAVTAYALVRRY